MAKGISLLGSGTNRASESSAPNDNFFIPQACNGKSLADLPVARVHPDPKQPRVWTEDKLDDLQAAIEGAGKIIQPITVIPRMDMPGHYFIKTGEGRWRVANRLGWELVPSVIEDLNVNSDSRKVFAEQILENIGRVGMDPMAIAQSIERWMNGFEPTQTGKEAAISLGLHETKISRYRKLLTANDEIKALTSKLTNINTLGYLIDLSRADEEIFKTCIKKIQNDELVNAERYLKDLVQKVKHPDGPKTTKPKKRVPPTEPGLEQGGDGLQGSPEQPAHREGGEARNATSIDSNASSGESTDLPPGMVEGVWNDGLISELENIPSITNICGAESDGMAVIMVTNTDGVELTLKLDYASQLKLRWLLDRCLEK